MLINAGAWGVLVEYRQLSATRLDVRHNHMAGIPLYRSKGLELLCVNPGTEEPDILLCVILLPALRQQRPVVAITVCQTLFALYDMVVSRTTILNSGNSTGGISVFSIKPSRVFTKVIPVS